MGIDSIMTRARIRESGLWRPFSHCWIGAMDNGRRVALFGLYSRGHENGFSYLIEISAERLQQIVDQYDTSMAELSADEQKVAIDIAGKHYLDVLEGQIHDQKMKTKRADIDAKAEEFDAKNEALEVDRLALVGLMSKVQQAREKAAADIAILEARIGEETINRNRVEVEIIEKELDVKKANLQVLEAGIRGLEIQSQIRDAAMRTLELRTEKHKTQQQVDLVPGEIQEAEAAATGLEADVTRATTSITLLDADIAELRNRAERAKVDAESRRIEAELIEVDLAKAKLDTAKVDADVMEAKARAARERARQADLQADVAMMDVRVAEIQLDADRVDAQLADLQADVANIDARIMRDKLVDIDRQIIEARLDVTRYEIPLKKHAQIDAIEKQLDVLESKIEAVESYQEIERDTHTARLWKENAEHAYKLAMTELDRQLSVHRAESRILGADKDVELAQEQREFQALEDQEQARIPESRVAAAIDGKHAAEEAAKTMASANIVNTMTHQIGAV